MTCMDIKLSQLPHRRRRPRQGARLLPDVLGLNVGNEVGFEGMRWVTVGWPSQPDADIVLEPPVAKPNASPADKEAMTELLAKG
jgi:hypothetical protein